MFDHGANEAAFANIAEGALIPGTTLEMALLTIETLTSEEAPCITGWVCPHPQEQAVVATQGVQLPAALSMLNEPPMPSIEYLREAALGAEHHPALRGVLDGLGSCE